MNLANDQERLSMMKKSQNGMDTIKEQLNCSRLSLEKECPVCLVDMLPPKWIFQCLEGHLVCSDCRSRANAFGCVTCRNKNGYQSRVRYIEDLVLIIYLLELLLLYIVFFKCTLLKA